MLICLNTNSRAALYNIKNVLKENHKSFYFFAAKLFKKLKVVLPRVAIQIYIKQEYPIRKSIIRETR